ncbi:MAG: hypothetical protein H6Q31_2274, partial [Bacteroidetes bacterium]|nr:hypothetical protein [Bacteroidota bacterium]
MSQPQRWRDPSLYQHTKKWHEVQGNGGDTELNGGDAEQYEGNTM